MSLAVKPSMPSPLTVPTCLAVEVDTPNPRGMLGQGDVGSIRWLHDGELDSVVLVEGHGPPRFRSSKWYRRRLQGLGGVVTARLHPTRIHRAAELAVSPPLWRGRLGVPAMVDQAEVSGVAGRLPVSIAWLPRSLPTLSNNGLSRQRVLCLPTPPALHGQRSTRRRPRPMGRPTTSRRRRSRRPRGALPC